MPALKPAFLKMPMTKIVAALVMVLLVGGLLLVPREKLTRDRAARAAYDDYSSCVPDEIFCAVEPPCPRPNCMGRYLLRTEEINRQHRLLSVLQPRHLLADWRPLPPANRDTGALDGTVLNENGKPVEGALVYADCRDRPRAGPVPHSETTANGRFAFRGLRWGHYDVYAAKVEDGYPEIWSAFFSRDHPSQIVTLGPHHQTASLTIRMGPKAGGLAVTVTDAVTSAPLSACVEFKRAADPADYLTGSGLVNTKRPTLIPSDTDVLWKVRLDGYKPWYYPGTTDHSKAAPLRLRPGQIKNVTIQLQPDAAAEKSGCGMPPGTIIRP